MTIQGFSKPFFEKIDLGRLDELGFSVQLSNRAYSIFLPKPGTGTLVSYTPASGKTFYPIAMYCWIDEGNPASLPGVPYYRVNSIEKISFKTIFRSGTITYYEAENFIPATLIGDGTLTIDIAVDNASSSYGLIVGQYYLGGIVQ